MSPQGNTLLHISEKEERPKKIRNDVFLNSWKSTVRPRVFTILAWSSLAILISGVAYKVLCISYELDEQGRLLKINQELVQQLIKVHTNSDRNFPRTNDKQNYDIDYQNDESSLEFMSYYDAINEKKDSTGKTRTKRSVHSRSKRDRKCCRKVETVAPCHLEGTNGPEVFSVHVPMQNPRTPNDCILWKEPDREPHSICFMETRQDAGHNGVQYIRIQTEGFYHVYSQVTYYTNGLYSAGHTVDVSSVNSDGELTRKTLITSKTPWKILSPIRTDPKAEESSYTAGVFYLRADELLSVHPISGGIKTIMSDDKSFFGAFYLGEFRRFH